MDYKASMDMTVKIITSAVIILFAGIIFSMYRSVIAAGNQPGVPPRLLFYIIIVFLVLTLVVCFGLSVWRYKVDDKTLVIVQPFYNKVIAKEDIRAVASLDRDRLGGLIRTFGNGGLFGYYGYFRSSAIGPFFFYGTQMNNLLLLEMKDGKKYILTPDDPSIASALK